MLQCDPAPELSLLACWHTVLRGAAAVQWSPDIITSDTEVQANFRSHKLECWNAGKPMLTIWKDI